MAVLEHLKPTRHSFSVTELFQIVVTTLIYAYLTFFIHTHTHTRVPYDVLLQNKIQYTAPLSFI